MIFRLDTEPTSFLEINVLSRLFGDKKKRRFRTNAKIKELRDKGKKIKKIDLSQEERLTFLGHSNHSSFGSDDISPEMLAQDLIDKNISKDKKVVIDLMGCSIGDDHPDGSYAERVANIFMKTGIIMLKLTH